MSRPEHFKAATRELKNIMQSKADSLEMSLEKPLSQWQDESLYFVANSFSEFLDKITADED